MTKTQLEVIKKALASAQRRASSTAEEGEKLWLHTWIIPNLAAVIGKEEGTVTARALQRDFNLPHIRQHTGVRTKR